GPLATLSNFSCQLTADLTQLPLQISDSGLQGIMGDNQRFDQAGIRVVRMGLQAGPELESSLLAGPWHPAFGELVASRLMLRQTRKLLAQAAGDSSIRLIVNDRDQSVFRGMKSANVNRLQQLGLWQRIVLSTDSTLPRGTVRMVS
ncbi:MAG: hypothetical protein D3910_05755, partial [Candidatus Electrothrix sp. ATG2]|nr:hypothetical protein [Candidatus Electrothrix sp. ATG2]